MGLTQRHWTSTFGPDPGAPVGALGMGYPVPLTYAQAVVAKPVQDPVQAREAALREIKERIKKTKPTSKTKTPTEAAYAG